MKPTLSRFVLFAGLTLACGLRAQSLTAPRDLVAKPVDTPSGQPLAVELTWANTATSATHLLLERSDDGAVNFAQIKQLPHTASNFSDKDRALIEGKVYHYRVRASDNSSGTPVYSPYSGLATTTTLHPHLGLVVSRGAMDQSAASDAFSQMVLKDSEGHYITVKSEVYNNAANYQQNKIGLDTLRYKITITLPRVKDATYSLLTLGIQANEHSIQLEEATAEPSGATVGFYSSENATTKLTPTANAPIIVNPVGYDVKDPKSPWQKSPREDNIWLVTLSQANKCTIWLEVADGPIHPMRIGRIAWEGGGYGESHDNEPPRNPPD
jgi:hypothetical protein